MNYLRQCTSIFKSLSLLFILVSCVDPVYQHVGKFVDKHFEQKGILRLCTHSLIDVFQQSESALSHNIGIGHVISPNSDESIKKFLALNKGFKDLKSFDEAIKKLKPLAPLFFKQCKAFIKNNCSHLIEEQKVTCNKLSLALFHLQKIKNSWYFKKLKKTKRNEIEAKISATRKNLLSL